MQAVLKKVVGTRVPDVPRVIPDSLNGSSLRPAGHHSQTFQEDIRHAHKFSRNFEPTTLWRPSYEYF